MDRYHAAAYDELTDPRARALYDFLVRYHQTHNGRRASYAEMQAATGLAREPLLNSLASDL